jgi:hypothetical protein
MAVKTATNYYSNAIVGTPQVGADVNVHEVHTSPRFAVGIGFERQDGARFRYVQYGADTEAGLVVSTDLSEGGIGVTGTNVIIQSASATSIAGEAVKPGAKGSHYLEAYLGAGLNQFAGGYLTIAAVGAAREGKAGYIYRIRGNTAAAAGGGTKCMLNLYEPLKYEIGTETCFGIAPNPWNNVEACARSTDAPPAGVSMAAASANQYGWVCTRGLAVPYMDAYTLYPTTVIGTSVYLSTATSGAIGGTHVITGTGNFYTLSTPYVGTTVLTGSNGTHACIALNLF